MLKSRSHVLTPHSPASELYGGRQISSVSPCSDRLIEGGASEGEQPRVACCADDLGKWSTGKTPTQVPTQGVSAEPPRFVNPGEIGAFGRSTRKEVLDSRGVAHARGRVTQGDPLGVRGASRGKRGL